MSEEPNGPDARGGELDSLRIRQVSALRRATWRSRSHAIIAAAVCAGLAIQFLWLMARRVGALGWDGRAIAYLVLIGACVVGTIWFIRRAIEFHRAAQESHSPHPSGTPDFSTLSDGSQRVRNLENIE